MGIQRSHMGIQRSHLDIKFSQMGPLNITLGLWMVTWSIKWKYSHKLKDIRCDLGKPCL